MKIKKTDISSILPIIIKIIKAILEDINKSEKLRFCKLYISELTVLVKVKIDNLKDFLNSDEDFTLKFSFNGRSAKNPNFQINNAKLRSNSYVSTVQSAMSYEFAFEFDTSDLVGAIETTQGALFNFTAQAGSVVSLTLGVQNSTVTVDWGDGSSDDYAVGTNVKSHAY